jgi:Holliday junction resolvase
MNILSLRELAIKKSKNKKRKKRKFTKNDIIKIKRQGYRAERELVRKIRNFGFKAIRIPLSAPSSEPLPDVFATKENKLLAFEVKSSKSEKIYFQKKQIEKLFKFLDLFEPYENKLAVLVCKFHYKWVFIHITKTEDCVINKYENNNLNLESL